MKHVAKLLALAMPLIFSATAGATKYEKKGETAGMDPQQHAVTKADPKSIKKDKGQEPVGKAAPGKPAPLKGKAAVDETAGMDPQKPGGQKPEKK